MNDLLFFRMYAVLAAITLGILLGLWAESFLIGVLVCLGIFFFLVAKWEVKKKKMLNALFYVFLAAPCWGVSAGYYKNSWLIALFVFLGVMLYFVAKLQIQKLRAY